MENKEFILRLQASGNRTPTLFEGDKDSVMNLAHSFTRFPGDVVKVEVWESDSCNTVWKWESPNWKE
jgi:hypothetical protein